MSVAGDVAADGVLVSVLNDGNNKLDQYLEIDAELDPVDATSGTLRSELTNTVPAGEPNYIAGAFPDQVGGYGVYPGRLAVHFPAGTQLEVVEGPEANLVSMSHRGNVKKLLTLTTIAIAMAALALMSACQTVTTNDAELVASKKEFLLAQSGFKVITVTTPKQQQAINGLAQYRVSAVKYNGKLYYVFPTAKKDKIYVGRQKPIQRI